MVARIRESVFHGSVRCSGSADDILKEFSVRSEVYRPPYVILIPHVVPARFESGEELGGLGTVFGESDEFFHF